MTTDLSKRMDVLMVRVVVLKILEGKEFFKIIFALGWQKASVREVLRV